MVVNTAGLSFPSSSRGFAQHGEEVLDIMGVRVSLETMAV